MKLMQQLLNNCKSKIGISYLGLLGIIPWILFAGCEGKPVEIGTQIEDVATPVAKADSDDLTLAFDALTNYGDAQSRQEMERALFYLNEWMGQGNANISYAVPKLAEQGPRQYLELLTEGKLGRASFEFSDLDYLRQEAWFKGIASRNADGTTSPWLRAWLKEREADLGEAESKKLAQADSLFGWAIRNIQLDEMQKRSKEVAATVGAANSKNGEDLPAAKRGLPGPGYMHVPWRTLLFGHGDSIERGRVFIHLARQAGIDAFALGVADKENPGATNIWAFGVYVGQQVYLFDAELGLPIPDVAGKGILTLAEATKSDEWIKSLETRMGTAYRVQAEDLKEIQVYFDAEPESLSLRMTALENAIKEKQAIKLTCASLPLETELAKQPGVVRVSLWRVPFEAFYFERNFPTGNIPSKYPAIARWLAIDMNIMMPYEKLAIARDFHLRGEIENDGSKPKSRQIYMSLRPSNQSMEAIETSSAARRASGFTQAEIPKDPNERAKYLETISSIVEKARVLKQRSTLWIGITHTDQKNYQNAVEWFKDRILEGDEKSEWRPSARYNLGYCYEELGQVADAIALYRGEEGPQKIGEIVRASLLEGMAK
ncbi:MAG: tetratricopeptide repeat protein [Planctomycetaceae bacterium]